MANSAVPLEYPPYPAVEILRQTAQQALELAQQLGRQMRQIAVDTVDAVFPPDQRAGMKQELTGIKYELNGVNAAINGLKGEVNLVNANYDLIKIEPPPALDVWKLIEDKRLKAQGLLPDQLQRSIEDVRRLARSANQNAGTAYRRADQIGSGVQRGITARLTPISQSITTLRTQLTQLDRRVSAVVRDATAAVQGVRRVGTDLDTARNQLNRRIGNLERRQAGGQRSSSANAEATRLRREGDLTRKAVSDLNAAVRGTSPDMRQLQARIDGIEQSLR